MRAAGEVRARWCVAVECQCAGDAFKAGERADHWLVGDSGANRRGERVEDGVGDIAVRPRPSSTSRSPCQRDDREYEKRAYREQEVLLS